MFVTFVSFKVLGYEMDVQIYLKYKSADPSKIYHTNSQLIKQFDKLGSVYLHVQTIEGVSIFNMAFKSNQNDTRNENAEDKQYLLRQGSIFQDLNNILKNDDKILFFNIFVGQFPAYNSSFEPTITDYRILECLLLHPRMSFLDIARSISISQRTVIRRINKMKLNRVLLGFSIIHNPSKMKGYNYYTVRLYTKNGYSNITIIDKLIDIGINKSFLRPPLLTFNEVIVLTFHSQNPFDIVNTIQMLQTIEGIRKVEYSQPLDIHWIQDWVLDEIQERMRNLNKFF